MAVSSIQLKKLQVRVKRLETENLRLKRQLDRRGAGRQKIARRAAPARRIVKLGGLWTGTREITEQDITEARKAVWSSFGQREL